MNDDYQLNEFKFKDYAEAEKYLGKIGLILFCFIYLFPATLPKNYPESEFDTFTYKPAGLVGFDGHLTFLNGDDPVIAEIHDDIRNMVV